MWWLLAAGAAALAVLASAALGTLIGKAICLANEREGTR